MQNPDKYPDMMSEFVSGLASMKESIVEQFVVHHLVSLGLAYRRGAELDDTKRPAQSAVLLIGRAKRAARALNPQLELRQIDAVVTSLSRPPHPALIDPAASRATSTQQ